MDQNSYESAQFNVILPLFGFQSDANVLDLSDSVRIIRYDPEKLQPFLFVENSKLKEKLSLFPPEYILWVHKHQGELGVQFRPEANPDLSSFAGPLLSFLLPSVKIAEDQLIALRLFKAGGLRRGKTHMVSILRAPRNADELVELEMEIGFETGLFGRAGVSWIVPESEPAAVGTTFVAGNTVSSYRLQQEEIPYIQSFSKKLEAFLRLENRSTKLTIGLAYYNKACGSDWPAGQVVDLFTCLEALLLQKGDELSNRLALRMANLIGGDSSDRKQIYQSVKKFYDVRSRLVHGDILQPRQKDLLANTDTLREYARRALLSVMSLSRELDFDGEFFQMLDEASLDDDIRKQIQEKAGSLLHIRLSSD